MSQFKPYDYKGLIITTYKISSEDRKKFDDLEHGDKVTFEASSPNGENAVFLKGVESLGAGKNISFRAKFVPQDLAARYTKLFEELNVTNDETSPLFCVHGFNVQPNSVLEETSKVWERFENKNFGDKDKEYFQFKGLTYYPIPVIWPCNTDGNYNVDQDKPSLGAGKHLRALVKGINNDLFPRKSLLMHSMGNHVVFDGACGTKDDSGAVIKTPPDVQFENIFMVSSDVPKDLFWKEPYDYDNVWWGKERTKRVYGQKKQKASNFFGMLQTGSDGKPKGKIYVVHNPRDKALLGSAIVNNEKRLGTVGYKSQGEDKVRDEFKDYLAEYNIYSDLPWIADDMTFLHSYHFEAVTIGYYYSKDIGE